MSTFSSSKQKRFLFQLRYFTGLKLMFKIIYMIHTAQVFKRLQGSQKLTTGANRLKVNLMENLMIKSFSDQTIIGFWLSVSSLRSMSGSNMMSYIFSELLSNQSVATWHSSAHYTYDLFMLARWTNINRTKMRIITINVMKKF